MVFLSAWTLLLLMLTTADAAVPCDSDEECQDLLSRYDFNFVGRTHDGWEKPVVSVCLPSRTCSNPFHEGCLRLMGDSEEQRTKFRPCNSDDRYLQRNHHLWSIKTTNSTTANDTARDAFTNATLHDCKARPDVFYYPEFRIHNGNWESSIFLSWIYQIILNEILEVPTTVGLTTGEVTSRTSFYSLENTFEYSTVTYPYWALGKANKVLDANCSKTEEDCCNVLPEVWATDFQENVQNDTIDPPIANGQIAKLSFYIPKFTAEEYPSLAIYYGYQGEANRKFLADTFKRPTTWQQYCDEISNTSCATADETAQRPPNVNSTDEGSMYYKEGSFNGYFRVTDMNDCTGEKSTTCTGHYVPPPCDWNFYPDSQLYWNDILGLDSSDGPLPPNGGYDYGQIYQVWRAAHATKSHVFVGWYQPEMLLEEFFLTDAAFQEVLLPVPTDQCLSYRPDEEARCSNDTKTRRGDARGACDNQVQTLVQLIASEVGKNNDKLPEAEQSPAYDFIKSIRISDLDINRMFQKWLSFGNVDRYGNDARMAVCSWVTENYDEVKWFIPAGYPRELSRQSQYEDWYVTLAQVFGILTGFVAILGMALVFRYRETKVMVFAQPLFLFLILSGFLAVAAGAALMAFEPTEESCIAVTWLINLGYSVELIPVLVKTAAINSLIQSSKKAKRVNISRSLMLVKVFAVTGAVSAYLMVWTVLDPSEPQERRTLRWENETAIVEADLSCASDEPFWRLIAFIWEVLLLVMAAVLAVQSKDILKEFNESNALGIMVYSHFLFMIIRGIFQVFRYGGIYPNAMVAAMMSFNYSADALLSMLIYVFPKFAEARKNPTSYYQSKISRAVSKWNLSSTDACDDDLKLLVCTANIGNEEPTQESMEAWIPLRGSCKSVTKFDGKRMREGSFDIIAIGMQESTWSENGTKRQSSRMEVSEEDILNAMEEHHTALLREMLQDILGAGYSAVAEDQRGQMRLYVWASNHIVEDITDVHISGANTGIGGVIANKGGIVITLNYKTTRMSFLSAHLAAHEGDVYYKARCDNLKTILRESKTFWSQKLDAAVSSHHMFAMGDLNFRTKFDGDGKHDENFKRAMHMIDLKDYEGLYEYDELQQGLKAGDFLTGFETLRCNWPPTFKVQREKGIVYKDQRVPSYTDRILFRSGPGLKNNLMPVAYEPCPGFITSDHKPIRGAYKIIPNDIIGTSLKDVDIRLVFHKMECAGLHAADSNGFSDPYLLFLWDSIDLIAEKRSFKDKIRKLVSGRSWPRTRYIAKTLNPKWAGESVALFAKNVNIGPEAMLFIVAMDADLLALTDDFLGATVINVKDATTMKHGETERVIQFDQNLERGGRPAGRIKFQLDVELTIRRGLLFTPLRLGDV